jgi:hypothetical protein
MTWRTDLKPETHTLLTEPEFRAFSGRSPIEIDFTGRPVIADLYFVSGLMMKVLGPVYWAALVLMFIYAEL